MMSGKALTAVGKFLVTIPLLFHVNQGIAFPFTTPEEYLGHAGQAGSCIANECHAELIQGTKAYGHVIVDEGGCPSCHNAELYPNRYGLEPDLGAACYRCHDSTGREFESRQFVHAPIRSGDCSACHTFHGSDRKFLLRNSYGAICLACHSPQSFAPDRFVHKPVKDGNCGLCHDPHASDYEFRLVDIGANLCLSCHGDMVAGMAGNTLHAPLGESGCTVCHDPHSGRRRSRLRTVPAQLCFTCHDEKKPETTKYTTTHKPASEGRCTACHDPHFSERPYLLPAEIDVLCYNCHEENRVWKSRRFQHGPVIQGNCTACHNPHGSDNASILRLSFPDTFYASYEDRAYSLCFLCHKEALVTEEYSDTVTSFRNGEKNLHAHHVKQARGRTCRACHDIHASDQDHHLRRQFQFGTFTVPINYARTETGGKCLPGCHNERGYDRITAVINRK